MLVLTLWLVIVVIELKCISNSNVRSAEQSGMDARLSFKRVYAKLVGHIQNWHGNILRAYVNHNILEERRWFSVTITAGSRRRPARSSPTSFIVVTITASSAIPSVYCRSFPVAASVLWNSVPLDIQSYPTLYLFSVIGPTTQQVS